MKIIISESQAVKLLKEAYGNQGYIDALLDKISSKGISSLTPRERNDLEKMSRGDEPEYDEPPQEQGGQQSDEQNFVSREQVRELFMNFLPTTSEIVVDGEVWLLEKEFDDKEQYDLLSVSSRNYETTIEIEPFATDNSFKIITTFDSFDVPISTPIKSQDDMEKFVDEFTNVDVKKIIQFVKKNK